MPQLSVADVDPDLFAALGENREARAAALAEMLWVERGPWDPGPLDAHVRGHFGLLVVDGILLRRVDLGTRDGLELLGPGDVLRPWVTFGGSSAISVEGVWRVHVRTRLAVLDRRFAGRVARWPEVPAALMDRLVRRQRFLAVHLAMTQMPRLTTRLRVLFWYLADRWGRVTPAGVRVGLPLTHELLAGLVGARRPGVTLALGELQRAGELHRGDDGLWVLLGGPPPELVDTQRSVAGHTLAV